MNQQQKHREFKVIDNDGSLGNPRVFRIDNLNPKPILLFDGEEEIHVIEKSAFDQLKIKCDHLEKCCKEFVFGEENPEYWKTMDQKVTEVQTKLDQAIEALKFYADKSNWSYNGEGNLSVLLSNEDLSFDNSNGRFQAGKTARETLNKLGVQL